MRFELQPSERPEDGLRRLGKALIDDAIAQVEDPDAEPEEAVHEARKDMKKLRGLLRLVRPAAPDLYKAENRYFRDAAAHLAVVRDADAALETFDSVLERARTTMSAEGSAEGAAPVGDVADASSLLDDAEPMELAGVRSRLVDYRDEAHAGAGDVQQRLDEFRARMLEARKRISEWRLPETDAPGQDFRLLGPGLKKTYKRGRKAMGKAYEEPSVEAFHDWRKRTKYLRYHLRLLRPGWPKLLKAQDRAVKELQSLLGDDHDLAVLEGLLNRLRKDAPASGAEYEAERVLRAEMRRQSDLLRQRARGLGEMVYAERPKGLKRRLGAYWRQAEREAHNPRKSS
jgi:CHAD domain-containing protein